MLTAFQCAIAELCGALGLDLPGKVEQDVFSLELGEHTVHIIEQPEHHLLMFCGLSESEANPDALLADQNLFSDNILKPIIGELQNGRGYLLWNRQPIAGISATLLKSQLEHMNGCIDQRCTVEAKVVSAPATALEKLRSREARFRN